jgi:hypothetical protein
MFAYQLTALYKTAAEVGADVNNPDGGPAHDMADDDIVEMIVDISNGPPNKLDIDPDLLTERQRERVLECYHEAAKESSP